MVWRLIVVALAAVPEAKVGKPVDGANGAQTQEVRFTDAEGEHLVQFTRTAVTWRRRKGEEVDERSQTLTVVHTVAGKEVWRAKDFVLDCPFDLELDVDPDSLEVSDADADGQPEFSFLYRLTCRSDVSPRDAKLLLYEGKTKYALRGTSKDRTGETEYMGGEFKADPAFDTAPKLLAFAKAKWARLMEDKKTP